MTDEDIELASDWTGDDGALVAALVSVGFWTATNHRAASTTGHRINRGPLARMLVANQASGPRCASDTDATRQRNLHAGIR